MSDCTLDIQLDKTDYRPGDIVTGTVDVTVHDDCDCRDLTVTCHWYTHGRGDPTTGSEQSIPLFEGSWSAGEQHSYEFEFRLPNGPCTYHGHYLNVDWQVRAVADLSWLSKPDATRDFRLLPSLQPTEAPYQIGDSTGNRPADAFSRSTQGKSGMAMVTKMLFFSVMISFCVIFIVMALSAFLIGDNIPLLFAAPFVAIPGLMLVGLLWTLWTDVLRNKFSTMKLGDLQVELDPYEVFPGDSLSVIVDIPPPSDVEMNQISLTLRAQERVQYQRGTNTRTALHSLHEQDHIIPDSQDRTIPDGEAAHFEYELTIPPEAHPTFRAYRNELNWLVDVHVDIAGWPDYKKTLHIDVVPAPEDNSMPPADKQTSPSQDIANDEFAAEGNAIW